MAVLIEIPSALQKYANNLEEIELESTTVQEALDKLCKAHADLKQHLFDDAGKVRSFINIYLNDEDIRYQDNLSTATSSGDNIQLVPSIAGGK